MAGVIKNDRVRSVRWIESVEAREEKRRTAQIGNYIEKVDQRKMFERLGNMMCTVP